MSIEPQGQPRTPTIVPPNEADAYLRGIGISSSHVDQAVEAGENSASNAASKFYPVTAAGMMRWIETVAVLRQQVASDPEWSVRDDRNRPTLVRGASGHSLSIVGGDYLTGDSDPFVSPSAARGKGNATKDAVNANPNQPVLIDLSFLEPTPRVSGPNDSPPVGNWFMLYHRAKDEILREISLPRSGFRDGNFSGWEVRVLLEPWKIQDVEIEVPDIGGGDVDFRIA